MPKSFGRHKFYVILRETILRLLCMVQILTSRVLMGHQMVSALNDNTVVRYFSERNDVTFS